MADGELRDSGPDQLDDRVGVALELRQGRGQLVLEQVQALQMRQQFVRRLREFRVLAAPRRIAQPSRDRSEPVEVVQHIRRVRAEPRAAQPQLLRHSGERPPERAKPAAFQRGIQSQDTDVLLHRLHASRAVA